LIPKRLYQQKKLILKSTIKTIILFFAFFIGVGTYAVSAQNPPAHAKAHGVKKKYRYYPEANVYFDPIGKRYTYLNGGRWLSGATLPNHIQSIGAFNFFSFLCRKFFQKLSFFLVVYKTGLCVIFDFCFILQ